MKINKIIAGINRTKNGHESIGPIEKGRPLKLLNLIWILICAYIEYGNEEIYYHVCHSADGFWNPIEVDSVDMRVDEYNIRKLTIW